MPATSGESFSGYVRLAAQAMLQPAMEAEAAEFIGRTGYQIFEPVSKSLRLLFKLGTGS